jgi:AcrR family transcriptional regulator
MVRQDSRPVGRTRASGSAPSEDPREDILIAASILFSRVGVAGTSIGAIAKEAGLKGPSLYHYFGSKQAIVETLIRHAVRVAAEVSVSDGLPANPNNRLDKLITSHLSHLLQSDYDLYFLLGPSTIQGSDTRETIAYMSWRRAVETAIREGCADGSFRTIDPKFAVHMIAGCIQGALQRKHQGKRVDPAEVKAFILAALASTRPDSEDPQAGHRRNPCSTASRVVTALPDG